MKFYLAFGVLVMTMLFLRPLPAMILFCIAMPLLALWFWRDSVPRRTESAVGESAPSRQDMVGRLRAAVFQFLR